ncbi:MAG: acetyl-CoA carboxylase biotin carboxyl carrier protein [Planctomycetota bacterium]|nr:acetyl-CoA carboxylase biotin carboxyl carrier protein [Planctomycetota bacterium]
MADDKRIEKESPGGGSGKIDLESIRQLLALMSEHDLAELEIEQEDVAVRLRKAGAAAPAAPVAVPVVAAAVPAAQAAAQPAAPAVREEKLPTVNSPMVGTFYVASSPEAAALAKVGDHVTEETVVCIIEAMKVFNEIRAEMRGTIEKILVKNAQAVEFGQPMFVVRPD